MHKTFGLRDTHYKMILSVLLRSTVIVAAFVIFLISSYLYGPEGRGVISFLTAFYLTLSLVMSFGLGRVVYQRVSKNPALSSLLFYTLIRYVYGASIVVFAVLLLGELLLKNLLDVAFDVGPLYFLLFIFNFPYFIWLNLSNFLFGAAQKTEDHDKLIFLTRIGQVLVLGIVAYLKLEISYFIFIFGVVGYFIFVLESRLLLKNFRHQAKPTWSESFGAFKDLIKDIRWPYVDSLAQSATPLAIFILGLNIHQSELGYYNFAIQILGTLSFPLAVFQVKLQEKLALSLSDGGATLIKRSFLSVVPISLALASCGLIIPPLIPLAGLNSFADSMPLLKALLLTLPLTGLAYVFQSVWVGKHKAQWSSLINIFTALLNILSVTLLSSRYGAMAGVIGMYVSLGVGLLIQSYFMVSQWEDLTHL